MPVVIVAIGGLPVTEAANGFGTPVEIVANGFGTPVTIVASGGIPVVGSGGGVAPNTLVASRGFFSVTGQDANLIYAPAGAYIMPAGTGVFTLTGDSMAPAVDYRLPADLGTFAMAGQAAGVLTARTLSASLGSFTFTGIDAALTKSSSGASLVLGVPVAHEPHNFRAGTVSFSGLNGGTQYPAGALVVVGVMQDQSSVALTSPQIGGNAATIVPGAQDSSLRVQFYQAVMAAASSDTFTFTNGNAVNNVAVAAAYMTGLASNTADTGGNATYGGGQPIALNGSPATGVSVTSGGFGLAFIGKASGGTAPTALSWTNTTSGSGDVFSSSGVFAVGFAHTATPGTWDPKVSGVTNSVGFASSLVAATWH